MTQETPQVEEGATVRGDRTSVVTRFDVDMVGFAGRFVWWIGYSISILILGLLLLAFAPQLFPAVRDIVRDRLGSSIGWGFGLFFLLPIGSVILLVTVVGIPLGLFIAPRARVHLHGRLRRGDAGGRQHDHAVLVVAVRGVPRRLGRAPRGGVDPVRRRVALVPRERVGTRPAGRRDPEPRGHDGGAFRTHATAAPGAGRSGLGSAGCEVPSAGGGRGESAAIGRCPDDEASVAGPGPARGAERTHALRGIDPHPLAGREQHLPPLSDQPRPARELPRRGRRIPPGECEARPLPVRADRTRALRALRRPVPCPAISRR